MLYIYESSMRYDIFRRIRVKNKLKQKHHLSKHK